MAVSALDLKHCLRKTDFPFCAREALSRVEQFCVPTHNMGRPSIKHMDLATEVMAEFVFCEIDRRGGRKRRLSSIQELQLLEVLCDYFAYSGNGSETSRNHMFLALFPPTNADRCRLLAKLVSMAISTKNILVLSVTGSWMQQLGCVSRSSLELAKGLVKDYFVLVPRAGSGLQDLPQLASHFTASFLTAVAEMYTCNELDGESSFPPEALLEVVTQWVSDHPTLCMAALLGSQVTIPSTPFAGLFRWCVLAPLQRDATHFAVLYSRLQLALLESILECRALQPARLEGAIPTQQLISIIQSLAYQCKVLNRKETDIQGALDRLAQALQLAFDSHLIPLDGYQELWIQLETLPRNRLLQVVSRQHRAKS